MKQYRITSKDVWNENDNIPDAVLPEDDIVHDLMDDSLMGKAEIYYISDGLEGK